MAAPWACNVWSCRGLFAQVALKRRSPGQFRRTFMRCRSTSLFAPGLDRYSNGAGGGNGRTRLFLKAVPFVWAAFHRLGNQPM